MTPKQGNPGKNVEFPAFGGCMHISSLPHNSKLYDWHRNLAPVPPASRCWRPTSCCRSPDKLLKWCLSASQLPCGSRGGTRKPCFAKTASKTCRDGMHQEVQVLQNRGLWPSVSLTGLGLVFLLRLWPDGLQKEWLGWTIGRQLLSRRDPNSLRTLPDTVECASFLESPVLTASHHGLITLQDVKLRTLLSHC